MFEMNLQEIRDQFPLLREKTFLDAACGGLVLHSAAEAVRSGIERMLSLPARSATLAYLQMDEVRAEARKQAAQLINAWPDEIALIESTTHGLTIAANAIPLEPGDRVLMSDLEFLSVALPWYQKQKEIGIEIDVVANRDGLIRLPDLTERVTAKTKVIAISSVQESNGFRYDLKALSAFCRHHRIWLVVDAIQHLGAMPFDVQETPVDFLACGGHKWLNAPVGTGFLYIRRGAMPELRPPVAGYMTLEVPPGGWESYLQRPSAPPLLPPYRLVTDARRYEIGGTGNYLGVLGLATSLRFANELGIARIAGRIGQLTDYLIAGLRTLGVQLATPLEREHRAGIVTFSIGSAEENLALMERLLDHRVLVSVRYASGIGGVRVSCHFYNSTDDLNHLLNIVEDSLPLGSA